MFTLISWFILSLIGGLLCLWAVWSREINRWRLVSLLGWLAGIFLSGSAILVSQGWSSPCSLLLPGHYEMIGYLPVPEERIYLFLNTQYGPKTCHIPWDAGKADELKKGEEGGNTIDVTWGEGQGGGLGIPGFTDGGVNISNRPPAKHEPKPEEVPFGE